MSRLYGKSLEVFSVSKELAEAKIPKYRKDKQKTTWEEVEECPNIIEMYLPESAIKIIENKPIRLVGSPIVIKETALIPKDDTVEPTMYFPRWSPIEEYKRELVFFLGEMLSSENKDNMPKENDIPCEFANVIGLLIEYLYLKETNQEDNFSIKHLNELSYNAKRYIKSYKNYQNIQMTKRNSEFYLLDDEKMNKIEEELKVVEKQFLDSTLTNLIPISSMEIVLQLIDKNMDKDFIKKLLDKLVLNPNHDRQSIINSMGLESFGYKSLRKEINRRSKYE